MRALSSELSAHLATGATTLAHCWRLMRRDGAVLGFTDHDVALVFNGVTHEPAAGFAASEIPASLGLNVDTAEISGALLSPYLTEADLNAGLYDGAKVELWLVNWAEVTQRVLLETGVVGEITRQGAAFTAEMRSLAQGLDQPQGRLFQAMCDADLGDARCTIDLTLPGNHADGTIIALAGTRTFIAAGLNAIAAGRLERGQLAFTSGANQGASFQIRADREADAGRMLELWRQPAAEMTDGDTFTASVGCDKTFGTCVSLYNNAANFRGFPHIPGTDYALSYVSSSSGNNNGEPMIK